MTKLQPVNSFYSAISTRAKKQYLVVFAQRWRRAEIKTLTFFPPLNATLQTSSMTPTSLFFYFGRIVLKCGRVRRQRALLRCGNLRVCALFYTHVFCSRARVCARARVHSPLEPVELPICALLFL